jgi:phospholipid/cholesterol/gamma-HCH transport system substrate-binding protein
MENRAHALIAGFFTLFLGAATLLALFLFGEQEEDSRELMVVTRQNVTGLNPQAQVRYRGIRVGKVLDIRLDPQDVGNILIRIAVEKDIPVTRGTTAKLAHQGVTGIAHVLLEDHGNDPTPLAGDLPRIAMQPSLLDHLENTLPVMLAQAQDFLNNANVVLGQNNRQHLEQTLVNLEAASNGMNVTLAQLQKLLSDENIADLSATIRASGPLMEETQKLARQLQTVSAHIDDVLNETGPDGGIGELAPRVNHMAQELGGASRQLKRVLTLLEDSPQSVIFGSPPVIPGPGEPGFSAPPSRFPAAKE